MGTPALFLLVRGCVVRGREFVYGLSVSELTKYWADVTVVLCNACSQDGMYHYKQSKSKPCRIASAWLVAEEQHSMSTASGEVGAGKRCRRL